MDKAFFDELKLVIENDDFNATQEVLSRNGVIYGKDAMIKGLLDFIESNEGLDIWTPGPVVHFLERYYGEGYEELLVHSVLRKPTIYTIWMLNRIVNWNEWDMKKKYIAIMKSIESNPSVNMELRTFVSELLDS